MGAALTEYRHEHMDSIPQCFVCGKFTREGKPYCPDHVLALGYPKKISDRWDKMVCERDVLNDAVSSGKDVKITKKSLLVRECLLVVAASELICLRGKIARELGLELDAVSTLAKAAGLKAIKGPRTFGYDPNQALEILKRRGEA